MDDVHDFVIEAEWKGETDFPPGTTDALKDLYSAFLVDSETTRSSSPCRRPKYETCWPSCKQVVNSRLGLGGVVSAIA